MHIGDAMIGGRGRKPWAMEGRREVRSDESSGRSIGVNLRTSYCLDVLRAYRLSGVVVAGCSVADMDGL